MTICRTLWEIPFELVPKEEHFVQSLEHSQMNYGYQMCQFWCSHNANAPKRQGDE